MRSGQREPQRSGHEHKGRQGEACEAEHWPMRAAWRPRGAGLWSLAYAREDSARILRLREFELHAIAHGERV